jgi:uncharacterized cupredoxin-like copper-binding protein
MNRTCLALLAACIAATPAAAQDWGHAQRVEVRLANFSFTPKVIHLKAGQPIVLHLVNTASGGHDFTAPRFFAAATMRPQDRGLVEEGSVEFRGHQTRDVAVVPKAGRYPLKCGHSFHKTFGMSGEIVVD